MGALAAWLDAAQKRCDAATEGPWGVGWLFADTVIGPEFLDRDGCPDRLIIAEEVDGDEAEFIAHARTDLPAALAALRAVLDLHYPVPVYALADECPCPDRDAHEVMESGTGDLICMASPLGEYECAECSHEDTLCEPTPHPCATVRAIAAALVVAP